MSESAANDTEETIRKNPVINSTINSLITPSLIDNVNVNAKSRAGSVLGQPTTSYWPPTILKQINSQEKSIAFVCHAPAALKNVKDAKGNPLVKGKKVTGFTNTEEAAVGLTDIVPFLVEDMLSENGGIYSKKDDWAAYAIQDGNLITGQNPASSELVAEKLLESLK